MLCCEILYTDKTMQNQADHRDNSMSDKFAQRSPGGVTAAGIKSSPVRKLNQESEAWFVHSPTAATTMTSSTTHPSSSSSPASKPSPSSSTPNSGNQNWYRHEATAGSPSNHVTKELHPVGISEPRVKPKRVTDERLAREAAAGNPNDWYRHDHRDINTSANYSGGAKKQVLTRPPEESLWFAQGGGQALGAPSLGPPASKTRHSGHDAELYYQRDKTGSGADWFPHEHHAKNDTDHPDSVSPASASFRSSTGNRTNAESPAWFPHDQPPSSASPRSAASAEVRKMQAQASGDVVRQILRVDDNLEQQQAVAAGKNQRTTATPPVSPRTEPPFQQQLRTNGGGDEADRYTENLNEQFQLQNTLGTGTG